MLIEEVEREQVVEERAHASAAKREADAQLDGASVLERRRCACRPVQVTRLANKRRTKLLRRSKMLRIRSQ